MAEHSDVARETGRVADPARLRVLRATGLLETTEQPALDRLTRMAARLLRVPVALLSLVDADRQVFVSDCGLTGEPARLRQAPLTYSYCRFVVDADAPLIVADARLDPRLRDHPAVGAYDAVAYAGFPLRSPDGHVLGTFCVLDTVPHVWTTDELTNLADLAGAAESEVALRLAHRDVLLSSTRLQAVLDSAHDAFVSMTSHGIVSAWNAAAERLFGWSTAEALGRSVSELVIPPRLREAHEHGLARVRADGVSSLAGQRLELAAVDRSGREFPVEISIQLSREHGELTFHAFLHDITARTAERGELERERRRLIEERAFLQALLDSLDVGVAACAADGRLVQFNRAMQEIHGVPPEDAAGIGSWAYDYHLYAADGRTPMSPAEVPLVRANAGAVVDHEEVVVAEPGREPRRFLANARPIDAPTGQRLGAVLAMHDITGAYRAEQLRRCRHAVAQVLSEATSARSAAVAAVTAVAAELGWACAEYWEVDEDRERICRVSSWIRPDLDLSPFTGDRPMTFERGQGLPGAVLERDTEIWSSPKAAGISDPGRLPLARRVGLRTAIGLPVRNGPLVAGVLAFFADAEVPRDDEVLAMLDGIAAHVGRFVERRRAEDLALALADQRERLLAQEQQQVRRLRELDRMKDELVAVVSHELRNPIGVISAYTEALREEPALSGLHELAVIERTSAHLLHLVEDLLDLARFDAGHAGFDPRPVRPDRLLQQAVEEHLRSGGNRRITVWTEIATRAVVAGDPARLRQVLDNLLSNAIKYTPDGGTVTVAASDDADGVTITVTDTGIGIPAEQYPNLFTRFFRASTATSRGIKGTGLGLAVTKAIVEAHGGSIVAEPGPEVGTRFTVFLPLVQP